MINNIFGVLNAGTDKQVIKIYGYIIPIVVAIFCLAFFGFKTQLLSAVVISAMYFWGLGFCILGHKGYYRPRKFSFHKPLRWIAFVIASLYFIYGILLWVLEDVDFINTFMLTEIIILLVTIQAVRNGYRD